MKIIKLFFQSLELLNISILINLAIAFCLYIGLGLICVIIAIIIDYTADDNVREIFKHCILSLLAISNIPTTIILIKKRNQLCGFTDEIRLAIQFALRYLLAKVNGKIACVLINIISTLIGLIALTFLPALLTLILYILIEQPFAYYI